ncbi:MAG: phosphate ABC transporter permease PstA [Dehalococcoidia bacterium]|nr:phosphate ABC transporter permease PstA [Dehalococcoidia bacterium]
MAVTQGEQFPAREQFRPRLGFRKVTGAVFTGIGLVAICVGLGLLLWLLVDTFTTGLSWLDWQFLTSFDSRFPDQAGAKAAIYGTAYMMFFTIVIALPIGVMSAIYLEEYAREGKIKSFVQINIANLAAVPSIIYGLLGLQVFVRWMELGRSVLAGSLTMALLILPIIVVATQEALRAVPPSIRDASYGVGATRWETIRYHVLPYAFPGILTGNILAASRAIGESAPLITIGALTYVPFTPENPLDRFTVLPIQIFNWVSRPQEDFRAVAAAGIIVLLVVLLLMNSVAIFLRQKLQRRF